MNRIEIFYLVLLVICFGSWAIYAYIKYREGKAKILQRRKDEIRRREQIQEIAPDVCKKIYKKKEETSTKDMLKEHPEQGKLYTPEGLHVVASVSTAEKEGLKKEVKKDRTVTKLVNLTDKKVKFKCGHFGAPKVEMILWGEEFISDIEKKNQDPSELLCPECDLGWFKKHCIQCCLCGRPIKPGDGVALYHKDSKGIKKEWATYVGDVALGCLGWNCCPSGGFFAGHWTEKGFKSAFEGKTITEKTKKTGLRQIKNV